MPKHTLHNAEPRPTRNVFNFTEAEVRQALREYAVKAGLHVPTGDEYVFGLIRQDRLAAVIYEYEVMGRQPALVFAASGHQQLQRIVSGNDAVVAARAHRPPTLVKHGARFAQCLDRRRMICERRIGVRSFIPGQ